jgi:hypothetical protein
MTMTITIKREQPIWVWMIYQLESRTIFGAMKRCDRALWTDDEARAEVNVAADEMQIGRIRWDEVDERTWVGRTDLNYIVVVTSVLLPLGEPQSDIVTNDFFRRRLNPLPRR